MGAPGNQQSNVLLVRHLPNELSASEKQSLLQHFGATSVKCMANRGRLKHAAFATFSDEESAAKALGRLHQLKVMGHTLVVEFARTQQQKDMAAGPTIEIPKTTDDEPQRQEKNKKDAEQIAKEKSRKLKGQIMSAASSLGRALRLSVSSVDRPKAKKMKLQAPSAGILKSLTGSSAAVAKPKDVFDQQLQTGIKKLEMKLPQTLSDILEAHANKPETVQAPGDDKTSVGFGVLQAPAKQPEGKQSEDESSDEDEDEDDEIKEFITSRQLRKNRVSSKEMESMSVFKRYNPGEPTTRLYIKNLSKQCEQKDLKFIYGRYVDWESKMDQDMFSIQLMTQGRMKGQAFVSLPSEFAAKKALRDTNGYLLQSKPMVVQFARSSKPKEQAPNKNS
ncbi:RNA-binding region-containing protein 3-like [Anneissia japonica]|uniref:RNA-binding region-containing protein 3-like n=1 Tax=Anneissia japonica TaxID=1529436 RepID=UPI0014256ABE|nr:RNA-binding region-containing protein 3-like [Anneissia japonica]